MHRHTIRTRRQLPISHQSVFQCFTPKPLFRGETDNADKLTFTTGIRRLSTTFARRYRRQWYVGSLRTTTATEFAVMMAPHHGSLAFDATPLLEWCRPKTVIISGNHCAARPEVIGRYALADQLGNNVLTPAIQVSLRSDGSIATRHWKVDHWEALPE